MALKYVDSAAAGANDGTSWTDAWTSILSADGAGTAAGDTVLIDDGHSETGTIGTLNFSGGTGANPIKIICVDKADDSLSSGAAIICNSGAMNLQGDIVVHGVNFKQDANAFLQLGTGSDDVQNYYSCSFESTGSSSIPLTNGVRTITQLHNCTLTFANGTSASALIRVTGAGSGVHIHGGTIIARAAGHTTLFILEGNGCHVTVEGVEFQNTVTNIVTLSAGRLHIKKCEMATYTNLVSAVPTIDELANWAMIEGSVGGTISVPSLGLTHRTDRSGTTKSTLSKYRTGGADDGEQANAHSWEMVTGTNVLEQIAWLESPAFMRWVDAGDAQTVTIYVASGVTLQDDEFWIEVVSPNETDSPNTTSQARYQNTRLAFQGTPANLTTDGTSTWNGTGVGTKQKITVTINPAVAGPVIVRACLAKPSTTVYVDPLPEVA